MVRNTAIVFGAMVTSFVATLVVWFGVVGLVGEQAASHDYVVQMLGNAALGIVVGGAVLLYGRRFGGALYQITPLVWSTRDTLATMAITIVTLSMTAGTMLMFNNLGTHKITMSTTHWGIIAIGLFGQIGVLHEELLFRWFVLNRFGIKSGGLRAIIVSAVLFMLMHIPFKGAGFMTMSWLLGGLLYGYMYVKTGSLAIPLAAHAVHNWALDLFMYSRPGVSLFLFAETRLVGWEKIGFELLLGLLLVLVTHVFYGRSSAFLAPAKHHLQHPVEQSELLPSYPQPS